MRVFFTERAYVSVLAETAEKIQTETGGIFLGYRDGENWYVLEAIDPGPKSTFQVAYFEYDQKYVNHLSPKIARLYNKPLELLGLWHRHPGSFDQFSRVDDGTNSKFASMHKEGAISALVNIDPEFRITIFHVNNPLSYRRVPCCVGDSTIPIEYRKYCDTQRLLDYTSAKVDSIWGVIKVKKPKYKYDIILEEVLKNMGMLDITEEIQEDDIRALSDEDVSFIIEQTEVDISYLGECYLKCEMSLKNRCIQLVVQRMDRIMLEFYMMPTKSRCMFRYNGRYFIYQPELFANVFDDVIDSMKRKRFFFSINKEFVECSILKMKKN